jgi:methylated-DNA-protein-cysteine methyltransferase-like protein
MAGNPRWSQIVGYALHANPEPGIIPCHRIVNKEGKLAKAFAFGGENVQRDMLKREGVTFIDDNTVDLEKCRYLP